MSIFGASEFTSTKRRSSMGLGSGNGGKRDSQESFGFLDLKSDKRDSLALPRASVLMSRSPSSGVDWQTGRRRSSGLGFWHDVVDFDPHDKQDQDLVFPDQLVKRKNKATHQETGKRKKTTNILDVDLSDYGKIKLGDIRRKQLKAAISDCCRFNVELRDKVLSIGRIKEASVAELFRMAEICDIIDFAKDLAYDRLANKHNK